MQRPLPFGALYLLAQMGAAQTAPPGTLGIAAGLNPNAASHEDRRVWIPPMRLVPRLIDSLEAFSVRILPHACISTGGCLLHSSVHFPACRIPGRGLRQSVRVTR
jgi:hypothetical protein